MDLAFWRQFFICFTTVLTCLGLGLMIAFPSALNAAIQDPNTKDINATASEASWLAASPALAGFPSFIIIPLIMERFGRKLTNIFINVISLVSLIIFVFAKNMAALLSARLIHGLVIGSIIINSQIISEYSHPKRRGYFIVFKKFSVSTGILLCHLLMIFCSWRQIALYATAFNVLPILMTLFWPESPAFLALKGKFEECEKSYLWLNGNDISNRKELIDLIATQKENQKGRQQMKGKRFSNFIKMLKQKDFQKALVIIILLCILVETSGRHYFAAYMVQMIKKMMGDQTVAIFCTVGNDLITILALLLGGILIRYFKRRILLFTCGGLSVFLMFFISAVLVFKTNNPEIANLDWLSVFAILSFSFITNIGVVPVIYTYFGEVFSLEHRGVGTVLAGMVLSCLLGLTLKVTPILMASIEVSGTFALNGMITLASLVALFFILPETKDKTLQDIEFEMKGIKNPTLEMKPMLPQNEQA